MTSQRERWQELERIFTEALALAAHERAAFLDRACPDAAMRAEVERLLAVESGAESRLRRVVEEGAAYAIADAPAQEPEFVGAYRLTRELGRGGMGSVWLAERADAEYVDRVAIKVIRPDAVSTGVVRRFLAERQILANLKHPNIARLLDGGTLADGRPYLVMEYIEGERIDSYCNRLRLDVDARIRLMREVCAAVQFAHANLIVHRDIKPGNILVTADGVPKLLDFGIAKILDPHAVAEPIAETGTGARLMTPAYASPEQIRGEPVTTASDVYALGVVLYELLTGDLPYRVDRDRTHLWADAILSREPERPSSAITRPRLAPPGPAWPPEATTAPEEDVARARSVTMQRLRRQLSGDIDTILLVALRKEPQRRYTSVEQFADDLRRHQEGLPVAARADAWAYRTGKFVRRHRGAVTAGMTVFLSLLFFSINTAVQAARIARERDAANREREKAESVTEFLVDVFEASDPNQSRGVEVTAREILAEGGRRIQTELADQPAAQAAAMETIGRVYRALGALDSAATFLEAARQRREIDPGPRTLDYARSLAELGLLARIREQYDDAERYHTAALELRRELLGEEHADVAKSLNALGVVYHDRGDLARAESLYVAAIAMNTRLHGREHLETVTALNNLSNLLGDLGRFDEAIPLQREALEIRRRLHAGSPHMDVAYSLNNLASVLESAGHVDEAEPLYRESLEMRQQLLPEGHSSILIVMNNLGGLRLRKGDDSAAAEIFEEVVRLRRSKLEGPLALAIPLSNLGLAYRRLGRHEDAIARATEAALLMRGAMGARSLQVTFPLNTMAGALAQQGRHAQAERTYREIIDIRREVYGADGHMNLVFSIESLAWFLLDRERAPEAEGFAREAVSMGRKVFSEPHAYMAESLLTLGRVLVELGRFDEAAPLLRESLAMRNTTGLIQPAVAQTQSLLGRALLAAGNAAAADSLLRSALDYFTTSANSPSPWLARTRAALARAARR